MDTFKTPNAPSQAKPQYKMGEKLVISAPAHSGLPNGATAIVACVLPLDAREDLGYHYAVTLTGGGANGSNVQFIKSIPEGWLRNEGRIATAKACAPMAVGAFVRLAPKLIVPLFQRRYCWTEAQWRQLWCDIVSPRYNVSVIHPHAIGRVVIAREGREAIVLVDGQQRTTTLMLLLCAVRDVAKAIDAQAAATIVTTIDGILLSRRAARTRRLQHGAAPAAGATPTTTAATAETETDGAHALVSKAVEQSKLGLESLDGADAIRFVPSRDDRLPFCSLVLSAEFDRNASAGARKMADCYEYFKAEALARVNRQVFDASINESIERALEVTAYASDAAEAPPPSASPPRESAASSMSAAATSAKVELLSRLAEGALKKLSVVVFELQDGVALQNMYDMLAQRERAISGCFANVGGRAMGQCDLVRNMLLGYVGDEDARVQAHEECWRPIERSQGEGDPQALERFLARFLHAELPAAERKKYDEQAAAPGASISLLEGFGALIRARGGAVGAVSLFAAGTEAADAEVVDGDASARAVLELLKAMRDAAQRPPM